MIVWYWYWYYVTNGNSIVLVLLHLCVVSSLVVIFVCMCAVIVFITTIITINAKSVYLHPRMLCLLVSFIIVDNGVAASLLIVAKS